MAGAFVQPSALALNPPTIDGNHRLSDLHGLQLVQTRANLVDERRAYAAKLAGHGERHDMERWRQIFVEIQNTITVVDAAILDEAKLSSEAT